MAREELVNGWKHVWDDNGTVNSFYVGNNGQGLDFTNPQAPTTSSGGGGGGGGEIGYGGSSGGGYAGNYFDQAKPYLDAAGKAMTQQMTDNFNTRVLPGISSAAAASGGYGGSRQGVMEANATNDLNQQIGNGLAQLNAQGFNSGMQYDLGRRNNDLGYYNAANSYNLGLGNLGLGYAGLDRQINNDNNSWAMQGWNLANNAQSNLMGNNQTGLTAGTNVQNTPMNYWSQFANMFNGIGNGYGSTTGSTNTQGNPLLGALGGAQLGGQLSGLWGTSPGNQSALNAANTNGTGLDGFIGATNGWGTMG